MIKSLQFDYLNKGNLETRVYENMVKSYSAKLSEVEEELVFMDAQQVMKTKGIFRRMFGFLGRRKV